MKKPLIKSISMVIVLALLAVLWPGAGIAARASVEPPLEGGLTLTADKSAVLAGSAVEFTAGFNMISGAINSYSATQVTIFLPAGLEYENCVIFVGGEPLAPTISPATTPMGTSVVIHFDNSTTSSGRVSLFITAKVSASWTGNMLIVRAGLYLQPVGGNMPGTANEVAICTLESVSTTTPTIPPTIPITPNIYMVWFDLAGGIRIGGGAVSQAVASGGSAIEPYVYRQDFIFLGWDISFYNVTHDLVVTARWTLQTDIGMITVEPPSGDHINGQFENGHDTFIQFSHLPMIYYAEHHIVRFESVEVDGNTLVSGRDYLATAGIKPGTTAIHLKASFLNTLPGGAYALRVNFWDGTYANSQFTVSVYSNPFYDVVRNDWFYKGVEAMNASRLMLGNNASGTLFDPYTPMKRAMVVTLLYRYAGEPSVAGFINPFIDVSHGQYYYEAVIWAAANGIVVGVGNGVFAPNRQMTREQFAAVLYRYQNTIGSNPTDVITPHGYSDSGSISLYAQSAVGKLTTQGVFRDWPYDPESRFLPKASVDRAEVATVMRLWIESIGW